jgi:hypothetical protein
MVDRPLTQKMACGQTGVPGADDDGGCPFYDGPLGDFDRDFRRVRQSVEHGGALLGLCDQRLDLLL